MVVLCRIFQQRRYHWQLSWLNRQWLKECQPLPENYVQIVEGFLILAMIDVLWFRVSNKQEQQGFSDPLKETVKEHVSVIP